MAASIRDARSPLHRGRTLICADQGRAPMSECPPEAILAPVKSTDWGNAHGDPSVSTRTLVLRQSQEGAARLGGRARGGDRERRRVQRAVLGEVRGARNRVAEGAGPALQE